MPLRKLARLYSAKCVAVDDHYIPNYHMHKPKDKHTFSGRNLVGYKVDEKKTRSYINLLIERAKEIPDPRKYSKVWKWQSDNRKKSCLP